MTPQEAHEWVGVFVVAGLGLALVGFVLGGLAAVAVWAWNEWKESSRPVLTFTPLEGVRAVPEPPECTCMSRGGSCSTCVDTIGYDPEEDCPSCPVHAGLKETPDE